MTISYYYILYTTPMEISGNDKDGIVNSVSEWYNIQNFSSSLLNTLNNIIGSTSADINTFISTFYDELTKRQIIFINFKDSLLTTPDNTQLDTTNFSDPPSDENYILLIKSYIYTQSLTPVL